MNAVDQIIKIAKKVCQGYQIEWGFQADVAEFIEDRSIARPLVFIAVGPTIPDGYDEDGKVTGYSDSFNVFLRVRAQKDTDTTVYTKFLQLRDALDGVTYQEGKEERMIQILAGVPGIEKGYAEAQITLQVS